MKDEDQFDSQRSYHYVEDIEMIFVSIFCVFVLFLKNTLFLPAILGSQILVQKYSKPF